MREQNRRQRPSIDDLPDNILAEILSRLPTETILASRCVCKTWLYISTNDPLFPKLHSSRPNIDLFGQFNSEYSWSNTIDLVDLEVELDRKHKRGFRTLVDLNAKFDQPVNIGKTYGYVNSCRGLFCLKDRSTGNPSIVYNPMTGEYVNLNLEINKEKIISSKFGGFQQEIVGSGFGFSQQTNQFKVLRILTRVRFYKSVYSGNIVHERCEGGELAVVGSNSNSYRWIGNVKPQSSCWKLSPVYLNGAIHWFHFHEYSSYMVTFDFDREKFGKILPPGEFGAAEAGVVGSKYRKYDMMAGVLRGCLCIWDFCWTGGVEIWMMKEYGVRASWRKEFVFDISIPDTNTFLNHHGSFRPMTCLRSGEIVILLGNTLLNFDPRKKESTISTLKGVKEVYGAVVHTPSFFPLKDVVVGDNVSVLKVEPNTTGST